MKAKVNLGYFFPISILSALTVLAIFVPFSPNMPGPGLDYSWQLALNQATAEGKAYGRELIFTYGPYASLQTWMYNPLTDNLMLFGGLFLALFYIVVLLIIFWRRNVLLILAFLCVLISVSTTDGLFTSYALLLSLVLYRLTAPRHSFDGLDLSPGVFVPLCAPLGFLPLIKVSMFLVSGVFLVLYFVFLWWEGLRLVALGSVAASLVTAVVAWVVAGQSIDGLPGYVLAMWPIVSGYTDAMSLSGSITQVTGYIGISIALLWTVALSRSLPAAPRALLTLSFAAFLFVAFKEGFVRHDDGRATVAASALMIAAILSVWAGARVSAAIPVILAAAVCTFFIDIRNVPSAGGLLFSRPMNMYRNLYYGIKNRFESEHRLRDDYDDHLKAIRSEFAVDTLPGTTDIYPYDQAYLLASKNIWQPRPVLQSYSAYTPALAETDRNYILSGPPDNVIFRVETIDNRIPSLDDGASWPVLLNSFVPLKLADDTLYLQRSEAVADADRTPIHEATHWFHETVRLPAADQVLFAQLTFKKTLVGRLASFLFKPDPLDIEVSLADGTTRRFRVIPGMTETGFVLTPLIESTRDFALLFGDRSILSDKAVRSIRIEPRNGGTRIWSDRYSLKLSRLDMTRAAARKQIVPPASGLEGPPQDFEQAAAETCEGSIDAVNGAPPSAPGVRKPKTLTVFGWTTVSGKDGKTADEVFMTVIGEDGVKGYIKASKVPRPDVRAYFGKPNMQNPGFQATADISASSGDLTLGIARVRDGGLHECKNFSIKLLDVRRDEAESRSTEQYVAPQERPATAVDACEGNIDLLNGSVPRPTNFIRDSLSVAGWMTASGKDGDPADAVFITLTGDDATTVYFKTTRVPRPDVNEHFGRLDMPDAGFTVTLPISQMTGRYVLSLARLNKGKLETCPRLRWPLSVNVATPCGRSWSDKIARWARFVGIVPSASTFAEVCEED